MDTTEEKILVNRVKKGSIAAFEELIIEHEGKIYNIAYRFLIMKKMQRICPKKYL